MKQDWDVLKGIVEVDEVYLGGKRRKKRPAHQKRHVQDVEHQLGGERCSHRPADDATAVGVEHGREVELPFEGGNGIHTPRPSSTS
jgi:hypothetical protein